MPTSTRQIAPFLRKSAANSQLPDGPTESSAPTTTLRTLCRGGRLCPPAGCTDFTGIFGEFTAAQRGDVRIAPYIQRGNCLRIRRKFSKEFTAFCRAEQSPAPTKIVRIFGGAPKSAAVESAQRKTGNRSFWFSCVYIFSRVMRTQETSTKSSVCSPFATRTACWTAT